MAITNSRDSYRNGIKLKLMNSYNIPGKILAIIYQLLI